jgi:hypothetical protein
VSDQLVLDVEPPLSFVPVCLKCGARGEPIPVDGGAGAKWTEAEAWSYLALKAHEPECPGKKP